MCVVKRVGVHVAFAFPFAVDGAGFEEDFENAGFREDIRK